MAKAAEENSRPTPWHIHPKDDVLSKLESSTEGLSTDEAERRLESYGPNRLPEGESRSALQRFLLQFHNMLIYILLAASVVTFLLGHLIDTGVILAVVLVNAIVGFIQEGKAEQALQEIRKMLSLKASVTRNGKKRDLPADELVPGDIVHLQSGDRIPADLRLLNIKNLRVEESALTGESVAVDKQIEPLEAPDAVPADRINMTFSGTSVVQGRATAVVVETGANTELGKINRMMSGVEEVTTPLLRQIDQFGRQLSIIILAITILFFGIGYFFHDYTLDELFLAVIALAVAAIPEALPAIMTITLATGVKAMASRNAIIRRLPSVETLGSVSVICTDKTGTLTRNEMTAKSIVTADHTYRVSGVGYAPEGEFKREDSPVEPKDQPILNLLLKTVYFCNLSTIFETDDGEWQMEGDPTEGALITLGEKAGLQSMETDRLDMIPFESEYQYMATLNRLKEDTFIFVKGAPEKLIDMCSHERTEDGDREINRSFWEEAVDKQADEGQRVIAAAVKKDESGSEELSSDKLESGLIFLGMVGMIDPPREEVIDAIDSCKQAGINVKMITGDHRATARAIGREIGIGEEKEGVNGSALEAMGDQEFTETALEQDVFARTSPEHKLRLVKALQAQDRICAMTGDGVNDAPALKRADVGIAMGMKGTEVTKDASDMVLADDNFATIASAVEEGRRIYDNLRKAILWILPTSGAESIVIMAAVLAGIALPITPVQVLWVNMVTATTLALAFAFEPSESGVMRRPPRDPGRSILDSYFIWRITFISLLIAGFTLGTFAILQDRNYDLEVIRTIAVNILVSGQLFYLFNCRKIHEPAFGPGFFENRVAFGATAILILLQIFFTYTPFMNLWFGTTGLPLFYWIYPLGAGLLIFIIVELEKWFLGMRRN